MNTLGVTNVLLLLILIVLVLDLVLARYRR